MHDEKAIRVSVDREVAGYSLQAGVDNYVPVALARHLVSSRKAVYSEEYDEAQDQGPIEAPATTVSEVPAVENDSE